MEVTLPPGSQRALLVSKIKRRRLPGRWSALGQAGRGALAPGAAREHGCSSTRLSPSP